MALMIKLKAIISMSNNYENHKLENFKLVEYCILTEIWNLYISKLVLTEIAIYILFRVSTNFKRSQFWEMKTLRDIDTLADME